MIVWWCLTWVVSLISVVLFWCCFGWYCGWRFGFALWVVWFDVVCFVVLWWCGVFLVFGFEFAVGLLSLVVCVLFG